VKILKDKDLEIKNKLYFEKNWIKMVIQFLKWNTQRFKLFVKLKGV